MKLNRFYTKVFSTNLQSTVYKLARNCCTITEQDMMFPSLAPTGVEGSFFVVGVVDLRFDIIQLEWLQYSMSNRWLSELGRYNHNELKFRATETSGGGCVQYLATE